MHAYRTHTCAQLNAADVGQTVRLSGWIHSIRDHGGLLFIDLRDSFGLTQCVIPGDHAQFDEISNWRVESVITIDGNVVARTPETANDKLPTGAIEVVDPLDVQRRVGPDRHRPEAVANQRDVEPEPEDDHGCLPGQPADRVLRHGARQSQGRRLRRLISS